MTRYTTRIAPSPTGDMHLGTARTAYFNWLAARASGGKFILRIDDTDTNRNNEESVDVIFKVMDWLQLDIDEVVRQSDRLDRYHGIAQYLVDTELATVADNGAILLNLSTNQVCLTRWVDTVSGQQDVNPTIIDSLKLKTQVLIKSDGMPTYHFASTIDDMDMGVNWVIRGTDHFTNTFRHVVIANTIGAEIPVYSHVGLININKRKMAKRDAKASMLKYIEDGISPDGILDYMMRLGWSESSGIDRKMITRSDALEIFLDGRFKSNPSGFDGAKLANLDRKHKRLIKS